MPNKRFRILLHGGRQGHSTAFHALDGDHPRDHGEGCRRIVDIGLAIPLQFVGGEITGNRSDDYDPPGKEIRMTYIWIRKHGFQSELRQALQRREQRWSMSIPTYTAGKERFSGQRCTVAISWS